MNKWLRLILFALALGLYFGLVLKSDNIITAFTKIIIVAALLLGMEAIRRNKEKVFVIHSDIDKLKSMEHSEFVEYVAHLYKKLGYYIDPIKKDKNLGCDLIARKNRNVICIKCISGEEEIDVGPLQEVYGSKNLYKANKCLVITMNGYTDQARLFAKANHITLIDQKELIKLISMAIDSAKIEVHPPSTQEA